MWHKHSIWDSVIAERLKPLRTSGFVVEMLDVGALQWRRSDGHITSSDCLHYCMPGPQDEWTNLLSFKIQELVENKSLLRRI